MADEKAEAKPQEKPVEAPAGNKDNKDKAEKGKSRSLLPIIIVAVIVLVAAGLGIGLGRLLASSSKPASAEEAEQGKEAPAEKESARSGIADGRRRSPASRGGLPLPAM